MSLSDLSIDYFKTGAAAEAEALAAALHGHQPFEARLLSHYAAHGEGTLTLDDGPWQGYDVWISSRLPTAPKLEQLWFDTAELTAMILVPRDPPEDDWHADAIGRWTPFVGWLSLRPVAVWQYRAFFELAAIQPRQIPAIPFTTYDSARILDGVDETTPLTRLTCAEAKSFANWMGKQLPTQGHWQAARRIGPDAIDRLWNGLKKEWIGYPELEDDEATAISPRTIDFDWSEERDLDEPPPPERRAIYRYYDWSRSIGFRTAVLSEIGLQTDGPPSTRYRR